MWALLLVFVTSKPIVNLKHQTHVWFAKGNLSHRIIRTSCWEWWPLESWLSLQLLAARVIISLPRIPALILQCSKKTLWYSTHYHRYFTISQTQLCLSRLVPYHLVTMFFFSRDYMLYMHKFAHLHRYVPNNRTPLMYLSAHRALAAWLHTHWAVQTCPTGEIMLLWNLKIVSTVRPLPPISARINKHRMTIRIYAYPHRPIHRSNTLRVCLAGGTYAGIFEAEANKFQMARHCQPHAGARAL